MEECYKFLMWKVKKSIDIIRRNSKSYNNVLEFLASLRWDSARSERENKMADGADDVSKKLFLMKP